jgi:uncharacterized protein (DUF885 family)
MTNEPATPQTIDATSPELAALAAEAWDSQMSAYPLYATALGDRRFDDRLRENGPTAVADDAARLRGLIGRTKAIDASALADTDRVTHSALLDFLRFDLDLVESGLEAWAVDPLNGPQVDYLNVPSFQPIRTAEEGEALVTRWHAMGPWVDRLIGTTREHASRGIAAPQALIRSVVAELDDLLEGDVETWPLNDPADDIPADWPEPARQSFARAVRTAVASEIRPAFARYRAFLADELLPAARDDEHPGLSSIPGGLDAYRRLVRSHTTLEIEPETIHRIGLEETERIDAEFRELGGRLLGTSDQTAVLQRLRTDPALYFSTPAEVFAVAEASLARANAAIPDWFGRLPQTPCVVVEMGAHEAKYSTIAYYRPPAADGSRPGSYYINTSAPETRPRYEAETLAFQ